MPDSKDKGSKPPKDGKGDKDKKDDEKSKKREPLNMGDLHANAKGGKKAKFGDKWTSG